MHSTPGRSPKRALRSVLMITRFGHPHRRRHGSSARSCTRKRIRQPRTVACPPSSDTAPTNSIGSRQVLNMDNPVSPGKHSRRCRPSPPCRAMSPTSISVRPCVRSTSGCHPDEIQAPMALADLHQLFGLAGTPCSTPTAPVRAGSVGSNTSPGTHSRASWRRTPPSLPRGVLTSCLGEPGHPTRGDKGLEGHCLAGPSGNLRADGVLVVCCHGLAAGPMSSSSEKTRDAASFNWALHVHRNARFTGRPSIFTRPVSPW